MPKIDIEAVGAVIRDVARSEALPRWRNLALGDIEEKAGPDDLVTVADKAVEAALSPRLMALLPGSEIVGEEGVHADPARLGLLRGEGAVWVIDPIDGTSAFAKGSPDFAVMVALVVDRTLVAGWIHLPVGDVTLGAVRGAGVRRAEAGRWSALARSMPATSLARMRGITGRKLMSPERLARIEAARARVADIAFAVCAGLEYPQLVTGARDFALYSKSEPWDHLPGLALAAEQGFHYARLDGSPYRPGDNTGGLLIAPDAASWGELAALLIG